MLSYEVTFSDTAKFSQSAVFNLQASDYVHWKRKQVRIKAYLHTYLYIDLKKIIHNFFFH